jgi:hypothetical protein
LIIVIEAEIGLYQQKKKKIKGLLELLKLFVIIFCDYAFVWNSQNLKIWQIKVQVGGKSGGKKPLNKVKRYAYII